MRMVVVRSFSRCGSCVQPNLEQFPSCETGGVVCAANRGGQKHDVEKASNRWPF